MSDGNPVPVITWTLNGQQVIKNSPKIKLTNLENGNFTYKCQATNIFGSDKITTNNKQISVIKSASRNYNVLMWAIAATVLILLVIATVVCRYAFKSTQKKNHMNWYVTSKNAPNLSSVIISYTV